MSLKRLYVYDIASLCVVAIYSCDANEHATTHGDAAAGCEHAVPYDYLTTQYAMRFDDDGLTVPAFVEPVDVLPLSKAPVREITPEIARKHLAEVVRLETERLRKLGVEIDAAELAEAPQ